MNLETVYDSEFSDQNTGLPVFVIARNPQRIVNYFDDNALNVTIINHRLWSADFIDSMVASNRAIDLR